MLQRVVRILGEVVSPIVVVAAPGQDLPSLPSAVCVVRDAEEGRGPMQGLAAGLQALHRQAEATYLSACDVPFLQSGFVRRLIELRGMQAICVPHVGGRHHPLAAVYRVDVLETVQGLLANNRMRPVYLFETLPVRIVEASEFADVDPELQSLRNLNTPEDYEAALRDLVQSGQVPG
jgi:molybdopterin-guanine dinucleotide biosynthesis protein A